MVSSKGLGEPAKSPALGEEKHSSDNNMTLSFFGTIYLLTMSFVFEAAQDAFYT
jgi:hypothetical protein